MNKYPLPEIEKMSKENRKIGLGVMGFADLLLKLNVPYNSLKAKEIAEEIMSFIQKKSKEASSNLAKERGNFPNAEKSIYKNQKMRNATTTTIAPTGTISVIAGCSSGIEPAYAAVYKRKTPQFELYELNNTLKEILTERGIKLSRSLLGKIDKKKGSIQDIKDIPTEIQKIFLTAHDISYESHIDIQSAFQRWVDNAVSKTINFSHNANTEDIEKAYLLAYHSGCKGLTCYIDGSRETQVLNSGTHGEKQDLMTILIQERLKLPRPDVIFGETTKGITPFGSMFSTINRNGNKKPYESFFNLGKAGGDINSITEGYGRLISALFKIGFPIEVIINQLEGIGGENQISTNGTRVKSLPDAIAQAIKKDEEIQGNHKNKSKHRILKEKSGNFCTNCGTMMMVESGCQTCPNCGASKCG